MKKRDNKNDQLRLFSSNDQKSLSSHIQKQQPTSCKQVFLNPRQEIYDKILNRKME